MLAWTSCVPSADPSRLCQIYTKYPQFRGMILDDVIQDLVKLPPTKRASRHFVYVPSLVDGCKSTVPKAHAAVSFSLCVCAGGWVCMCVFSRCMLVGVYARV